LGFGIGEGLVLLVAGEGVQEVAGEQGPGGAVGLGLVFARAESGQRAAALDEAVVGGAVEAAQDQRTRPGGGQRQRVGVHARDVGSGQQQGGGPDLGGQGFRGGRGGGGEERDDGGDLALGSGDDRGSRAHAVSGQGQLAEFGRAA